MLLRKQEEAKKDDNKYNKYCKLNRKKNEKEMGLHLEKLLNEFQCHCHREMFHIVSNKNCRDKCFFLYIQNC